MMVEVVMMMKVVIIVIVMITNYSSNNDSYIHDGSGGNSSDDIRNGDDVKCGGRGSNGDGTRLWLPSSWLLHFPQQGQINPYLHCPYSSFEECTKALWISNQIVFLIESQVQVFLHSLASNRIFSTSSC